MIEAEFTDINVPAKLAVNGSAGGISGLTVGLEILNANTQNFYLDFADGDFKQSGWTTKSVALTDVGNGRYSLNNGLDVSAMNIPTGVKKLILEYNISGAKSGSPHEELLLRESTFQAKIWFTDNNPGVIDRYTIVWYKNSEPVTTGVTVPTVQVIQASDGVDLVPTTPMVQVAALGIFRYDETATAKRIVNGASYYIKAEAFIEGKTRIWYQQVSRDS